MSVASSIRATSGQVAARAPMGETRCCSRLTNESWLVRLPLLLSSVQLEKKSYYAIFQLSGFSSFDGQWTD